MTTTTTTTYRVIAYAYCGNSTAPYRAFWDRYRARDRRAVLRRVGRRTFGAGVQLASGPVWDVRDRDGRNIYGPWGREVIPGGIVFQVWDHGVIAGYVGVYDDAPAPVGAE